MSHITQEPWGERTLDSVTLARLISPSLRSGLLTLVGAGLILAPLVFELGVAAGMTGFVLGALCISLAIAGTESSGRGTIPLAAQAVYDRGLGVGLVLSGVAFGAIGEVGAMALFLLAGTATLLVTSVTRYSAAY